MKHPELESRLRGLLGIASAAGSGRHRNVAELSVDELGAEVENLLNELQSPKKAEKKDAEDDEGDANSLETLALHFLDVVAKKVEDQLFKESFDGNKKNDTELETLARKIEEATRVAARHGVSYSDPALFEIRSFKFPLPTNSDSDSAFPVVKNVKPVDINLRLLKWPTATFGLAQWGSGILLSHMLSLGLIELRPPVLDIGTGAGLVGLTAAKLLASHPRGTRPLVTLSDLPSPVLINAQHNLLLNSLSDPSLSSILHLNWSDAPPDSSSHYPSPAKPSLNLQKYTTILATDVIYDLETASDLARILSLLLARTPDARIYVLIPARLGYDRPLEFFMRGMFPAFGEGEWSEVGAGLISQEVWEESAMTDGFRMGVYKWPELEEAKL